MKASSTVAVNQAHETEAEQPAIQGHFCLQSKATLGYLTSFLKTT